MIVVDSSALLAICFNETEHAAFVEAILSSDDPKIGAPNFVEASIIVESRRGEPGWRELDRIAGNLGLAIVTFDAAHATAVREAFRLYGRGRHRAALNFGDCCACALAKTFGAPLLFKGQDFIFTDIERLLQETGRRKVRSSARMKRCSSAPWKLAMASGSLRSFAR